MSPALQTLLRRAADLPLGRWHGRVEAVSEVGMEVSGLGPVQLGEVCQLLQDGEPVMPAEVVAVRDGCATLVPLGHTRGTQVGQAVLATGDFASVGVGPGVLGRVLGPTGEPMDDKPQWEIHQRMPLHPDPINPLKRARIDKALATGVRAVDTLLPFGRGQRLGLFSGSGVGKTSLLGMMARNVDADVRVIALIGERGREASEFVHAVREEGTADRTVFVIATAEQPALLRSRAAYTAMAVSEYFRAQGQQVFLMMDSVTRFAMARREVDLAAGLPATARGYTPTVFSAIPALCERCGAISGGGAITALFTVLVEGDDHNEPVADTLRATLDGHIVLSRELAHEGHYPAIDVLQSISRLETQLLPAEGLNQARHVRRLLSVHRRQRDMVDMGLYKSGSNADLDEALQKWPLMERFLRQELREKCSWTDAQKALAEVCGVTA